MKALVTGATGFVGPRLLRLLDRPVVLSRDPDRARHTIGHLVDRIIRWDPLQGPPPQEAFQGVDAVMHLAGESVAAGRWTAARKAMIRDSRVIGTRNLVQGIVQAAVKPRVLVSASAVGYYGDRGEEELTEAASPASDFLAQVCVEWEREALAAERSGVRVALARTGIVLGSGSGGALSKMLLPFKLGAGGPLGNGRQWMSCIHVDDVAGLILWAIGNESISGPVNAVCPEPVRNTEFTRALAQAVHRPAILPAPGFALRLALGELSHVMLDSVRVIPEVALSSGYRFRFSNVEAGLQASVGP